jgi:UDP-N-acetylglucosamine 3-dehydrogenase
LGVGVIGVGGWGKHHARVYKDLERTGICKLIAVSDLDAETAKRIASIHKVEAYADNQGLLSRRDIQVVSICTPTATHQEVALEATDAGKHLLVEKPLADTVEKALSIVRAATRRRLRLSIGLIERYNQGLVKLKETIDAGRIGEARLATAQRISRWTPRPEDAGVIAESAIHDIDAIRYLFGEDPSSVYASSSNGMTKQVPETEAILDLTFESGRIAHIAASWLSSAGEQRKIRQLQVVGSRGTAILFYLPQIVWKVETPDILSPFVSTRGRPRYSKNPKQCVSVYSPEKWREPLREELADFLRSVLEPRESSVTVLDGVRALEVAEAARKSMERGSPVRIDYNQV